jgi:hypothetical protein
MFLVRSSKKFSHRGRVFLLMLVVLSLISCGTSASKTPGAQNMVQTFRYEFGQADADFGNLHAGQTVTIPIRASPDRITDHVLIPLTMTVKIFGPVHPDTKEAADEAVQVTPLLSTSTRLNNQTPRVSPLKFTLPSDVKPGVYAIVSETADPNSTMSFMGRIVIKEK